MNHSDIRGSRPHDHDSSGAASLEQRAFATGVGYRIKIPRILLSTSADQISHQEHHEAGRQEHHDHNLGDLGGKSLVILVANP
jgi:hypothetical protein